MMQMQCFEAVVVYVSPVSRVAVDDDHQLPLLLAPLWWSGLVGEVCSAGRPARAVHAKQRSQSSGRLE